MDRFKEVGPNPNFRAKKSVSGIGPAGKLSQNLSENVMCEPVSSVAGTQSLIGKSFNSIGDLSAERPSAGARQFGNTFPQMRQKKSTATNSVSPPLSATKSVNTHRVRFAQQKTANIPRLSPLINAKYAQNAGPLSSPARKAGSSLPFRKDHQPPTNDQPPSFSVKIARPFLPLWKQLDDEYERVSKRKRDVRRISSSQRRENIGQYPDQIRSKANIAPKLRMWQDGKIHSSSSEDEENRPRRQPPTKIPSKITGGRQLAAKKFAARKTEFVDAITESGSTTDGDSQEDQLLSEEYDLPSNRRFDDENAAPPTTFSRAPQITIPLPQVKTEPEDSSVGDIDPPEELLNAVEALIINPIRMQATRQLPFLRRNLRQGFIARCADVLIPIHPNQKRISLAVTYEHVDNIVFRAEIEDWLCPLCGLFGKFTTQATLCCHLKWDHQEIFSNWEKSEETDVQEKWKLQVMIPQEVRDGGQTRPIEEYEDEQEEEEEEEETEIPAPSFSSPFPSVSLSPPSVRQQLSTDGAATSQNKLSTSKTESFRETPQPPMSRSISTLQDFSSRSRSTTASSTVTASTSKIPRDTRYPTFSFPEDPLGPAAKPPYLPAYSEYGGPTVYYSCRPGGACLFDLLGTLPMKEFGILEWEVLDREEEIYESDDVKEEYKVMHALWGRWIMLHRNEFISNFHQGTLAFVDYYWRMIHRAAGWDALRYWLLILLANRFLNAHEVVQVLTHYEELIGMASQ